MSADFIIASSSGSAAQQPSELRSEAALHLGPFDKLPSETISEIFNHACPAVRISVGKVQRHYPPREECCPWILSMVCKRWHFITLGNPSLWANPIIPIRGSDSPENHQLLWGCLRLRLCLERSGAYPLSICIDGRVDKMKIIAVLDIIMPHSERWCGIEFEFALGLALVQKFSTLNGRLPLLEHLNIILSDRVFSKDDSICTTFLSAPRLHSLFITSPAGTGRMAIFRRIQIPWTQISEVTFGSSAFRDKKELYKILGCLSVSLTSLTFSGAFDTEWWPGSCPREITLPKLRRLRFLCNCFVILDVLVCLLLEELEIRRALESTVIRFLDFSSCALTHIQLFYLTEDGSLPTYHTILQHSSLSTLKSISLSAFMDPILDLLNFDSHQLFPLLETLHLDLEFDKDSGVPHHLESTIEGVRKVVDSRTCTTASDDSEYSINDLQSKDVQQGARSCFRECLLDLDIELDGPDADEYWDSKPIRALQSFCISRNILVSLEVSHCWSTYALFVENYTKKA